MALAIYEMEPIGVDGALEAVYVHWFCSDACVEKGKAIVPAPISIGINNDWTEGIRCESCSNLVEDTPTNGAVPSDEEIASERSQLTQGEQKTLSTLPTLSEDEVWYVNNKRITPSEDDARPAGDEEEMDTFLNDATLAVRELWENAGFGRLGENETYALNDVLTAFLAGKR